jgi:hypothetical protein
VCVWVWEGVFPHVRMHAWTCGEPAFGVGVQLHVARASVCVLTLPSLVCCNGADRHGPLVSWPPLSHP